MSRTTRTFEATITNQQQVRDDLDQLGWAASKLWNVGRYYAQEQWDETGEIPDDGELKAELKSHERYTDLHSQSSQRVLEELAEAFNGWFSKRRNGDNRARPPGYRKNGDSHPRSTVSFKAAGFKHDAQFNRVRLSKGRNLKEHRSDFILCEYQTRPDVDLTEWDIQQVRAVYKRDEWRLQFVCRTTIDPEPPGDEVAGVDLGICNFAAVSFGGESVLYPGGALKEDEYYFTKRKPHATILRPVRPLVSTASERVVGRTSCTHSRKQSWRSASNEVLVRLSLATSVAFERTTRAANLGTGATTAISICTDGRSTASRRYLTTRRKPRVSTWSWFRNEIRRSRVRRAVTRTTISALNADCTCARSATRLRTRT